MKTWILMTATILAAGCTTLDRAKDELRDKADELLSEWESALIDWAGLDKLVARYVKPAPADDGGEGWNPSGAFARIDFGGAQTAGVFQVELRGMKPGAGTGANGTTGSGNHPERLFVAFKGSGLDKATAYTMHKSRNAVRTNVRSKDKTIAYQCHNSNTHGNRPEPTVWRWAWRAGKLWVYAGDTLLKDYPQSIGDIRFTSAYVGGESARPFEGEWRNAKFESKIGGVH
jgi:hypothetical protein